MGVEKIVILNDRWLSTFFPHPVRMVSFDEHTIESLGRPDNVDSSPFEMLREIQSQPVFISAKVPVENLEASRFLEERNFRLIDTNVTFTRVFDNSPFPVLPSQIEFRRAEPVDRDAVVKIARHSFRSSRFHRDPEIPNPLADEVKAAWANNYFDGKRGDDMVVAVKRGQVIGFAQLLTAMQHMLTIDLIAVDPNFQRQGAAVGMLAHIESMSKELWPGRHEWLQVGTQLANQRSVSLYQSRGFRFLAAQYVFHFHNDS